jgi:ribosomal protein S12 methylthiotransferase
VLIEGQSLDADSPISLGRSYRDAPEVDGVVLLEGRLEVGAMVRSRIQRALEYDLVATPVSAPVALATG